VLFAADPELGVVLPAPGFPQVLRGAAQWRQFLEGCVRDGEFVGAVPGPDGDPLPARGCATPDGTAAVLVAPPAIAETLSQFRPLLPLLGALFRVERQMLADTVRARSAVDAAERAGSLAFALQQMRQRLEHALVDAEEARTEARGRAEQAESLASELRFQATRLQEQAVELELLNVELGAHTEEAERARAAADEANRAKSEFLANMSHELRTPINAVIGYAELLDLGISGPINADQKAHLERIRVSSTHLLHLVNDVLDLAKVEAGRMSVRQDRESVRAVVAEAVALLEGEAAARSLQMENRSAECRAGYLGDRDRVRQILVNLLSNAVKFTEPGGSVTVECGSSDRLAETASVAADGPWSYISVEDTGIGMDEEELREIFRPFVQSETGRTRTRGGTGLGLTISRQLARLMGGDLVVQSEPGAGSRFTLWLPAAGAARAPRNRATPAITPAPGSERSDLAAAGLRLEQQIARTTAGFARRAASELPVEKSQAEGASSVDEFAPVLIAELARVLKKLGRAGTGFFPPAEPTDVLRSIASEHGADRGGRGWDAEAVRHEFGILRDEIVSALRTTAKSAEADAEQVVEQLLSAARRTSLRSHGAAAVVIPPPEAR